MFKISQSYDIANRVKGTSWAIRSNIVEAVKDGMKDAEVISKTKFLSGMGRATATLNKRSGALHDSVHGVGRGGPKGYIATGELYSEGVEYAAAHEYGAIIQHPGARAFFYYLKFYSKKLKKWIRVLETQPHTITIPQRSFLGRAMDKVEPHLTAQIEAALEKAARD